MQKHAYERNTVFMKYSLIVKAILELHLALFNLHHIQWNWEMYNKETQCDILLKAQSWYATVFTTCQLIIELYSKPRYHLFFYIDFLLRCSAMTMMMKLRRGLNWSGQRCNCWGESPRFGSIPNNLSTQLKCIKAYFCIFVFQALDLYPWAHWAGKEEEEKHCILVYFFVKCNGAVQSTSRWSEAVKWNPNIEIGH